jgi:hypothetical protein
MNRLLYGTVCIVIFVLVLSGCGGQKKPDLKKDIIGTWEVEVRGGGPTYQFTTNGEFIVTSSSGQKQSKGTYMWVDDERVETHSALNDGKPLVATVKEISRDKINYDISGGLTLTLNRIKDSEQD